MLSMLSHIAIWTSNLENSRAFYQKYFNGISNEKYTNTTKGFSSYFVTFNNSMSIEIMQRTDIIAPNTGTERIGLAHMAFTVNSKEDVHQLIEQLRTDGYTVNSEARTTGDGFYEASVLDPDGNILEIVACNNINKETNDYLPNYNFKPMKVLIDNGHGEETPGKRSPDGKLREYLYAREIAEKVIDGLTKVGINAERIVKETTDVPLTERCKRVNDTCKALGAKNVLLVSIHCNAAGMGEKWMSANGWSAHVSLNASQASKALATCLIQEAQKDVKVRKYAPTQAYWCQNLAICRDTNCAAVLVENMFQDNQADVEYLLSPKGKQAIIDIHVNGIINYLKRESK